MKIEISPQELVELLTAFNVRSPSKYLHALQESAHVCPPGEDGEKCYASPGDPTSVSGYPPIPPVEDHKEQGFYQSADTVELGEVVRPDFPAVTLADPRSAAEITVVPPAKRTRKKKAAPEELSAASEILKDTIEAVQAFGRPDPTPPATSVFGGIPVPPAPRTDTPVPPAPPAPPAAPEELDEVGKFMNKAIESIRAQRMTHDDVMALLREFGVNNFAELKDNQAQIPAIMTRLK